VCGVGDLGLGRLWLGAVKAKVGMGRGACGATPALGNELIPLWWLIMGSVFQGCGMF